MLGLKSILAVAGEDITSADQLPQHGGLQFDPSGHDVFLIIGLGLVLALALFYIVYVTRGKRARRNGVVRSSRVLYRPESSKESSSGRTKIRKRRKSHPDNLPRNPTLGETGGLPPLRPQKPSQPVA